MEGICGDANGDSNNDLRLKDGTDVSASPTHDHEVCNSHQVYDDEDMRLDINKVELDLWEKIIYGIKLVVISRLGQIFSWVM